MRIHLRILSISIAYLGLSVLPAKAAENNYSPAEITAVAEGLFGDTTEGLAKAMEKAFADLGIRTVLSRARKSAVLSVLACATDTGS